MLHFFAKNKKKSTQSKKKCVKTFFERYVNNIQSFAHSTVSLSVDFFCFFLISSVVSLCSMLIVVQVYFCSPSCSMVYIYFVFFVHGAISGLRTFFNVLICLYFSIHIYRSNVQRNASKHFNKKKTQTLKCFSFLKFSIIVRFILDVVFNFQSTPHQTQFFRQIESINGCFFFIRQIHANNIV